ARRGRAVGTAGSPGLRTTTRGAARGGRGFRGRGPASSRRRRPARRRRHRGPRRPSLCDAPHAHARCRRHQPGELLRVHRAPRDRPPGRRRFGPPRKAVAVSPKEPRNPFVSPRFGQIATFMLLPAAESLANLDVALLGIPYDGGTSYRTGARFG